MKLSILTLFLIIPFLSFSQTEVDVTGVLGIPFGSPKEKVNEVLIAKGAKKDLASKAFLYTGVSFGAYKNCMVIFSFINSKLYQALIMLPSDTEGTTLDRYEELNSELAKKYGKGETFSTFKYPYEKGDGHELTAIKIGKAEYNTYWIKQQGSLSTYITKDLYIFIKYQDRTLIKEVVKEEDSKNVSEY